MTIRLPQRTPLEYRPVEPEAVFQRKVVQLLELHGFAVYHTNDSRRSQPGFPDIVAIKGNRGLALELKSEKGRVSHAQMSWRALFDGTMFTATIIRPSDWDWLVKEVLR